MTDPLKDIPKISTVNTKKQMLDAFNRLKEKYQEQAKAEMQPERAREAQKEKETVQTADAVAELDILRQVDALKANLNSTLAGIASRLAEESRRYSKLKEAIAFKDKELQELFEIEKSAFALAALLEAQKLKKLEFEAEMVQRKNSLEAEIEAVRSEWDKERQRYQEQVKEQKKEDEKNRSRSKEEFEYSFAREQGQKKAKLEDELTQLEKSLAKRQEEFETQLAVRDNALRQREAAVSEREKRMDELHAQVEAFPQELDGKVARAVKEATDLVRSDAKKNEALIVKGFEGEKNVLLARIEALEKVAATQNHQLEAITRQLENAYGKVQDIAVKAVAGPHGSVGRMPVNLKAPADGAEQA